MAAVGGASTALPDHQHRRSSGTSGMTVDAPSLTVLSRAQCLALLARTPVGRIAYQAEVRSTAQPVMQPATADPGALPETERSLLDGRAAPGLLHPTLSEQVDAIIGLLFHAGFNLASIRTSSTDTGNRAQAEAAATTLNEVIRALRLLMIAAPTTDAGVAQPPAPPDLARSGPAQRRNCH